MKSDYKYILLLVIALLFLKNIRAAVNSTTHVDNNVIKVALKFPGEKFVETTEGKLKIRDYYEFTDPSRPGEIKLPYKEIIVAIPPYSRPVISDISYKENSEESVIPKLNPSAGRINDSTVVYNDVDIPNRVNNDISKKVEIIEKFWFRDFYCAKIRINTYSFNEVSNSISSISEIKFNLNFPGLVSFVQDSPLQISSQFDSIVKDVIINNDFAEQFRSKPKIIENDSTSNWINFNSEYVKIGIASDDIFKITGSELLNKGVNISGINPSTFQIYTMGNEIPLYVLGSEDSFFDQEDYLLFFGHKNYSPISYRIINNDDEDYNEYLNRYSDTTFYFLTWGSKDGLRLKNDNNFEDVPDTLNYFMQTNHYETNTWFQNLNTDEVKNQLPFWQKNKSWYWNWIFAGNHNYKFNAENIVAGKNVKFYLKAVSAGSNVSKYSHQLLFSFNGNVLDSQSVDKNKQVLMKGELASDKLDEGDNNVSLLLYNNGTSPNFLALDWYEIEYPKRLMLENDSLIFTITESDQIGERILKLSNAGKSSYVIMKVGSNQKYITNYTLSNGNIIFYDTLSSGEKYIVRAVDRIQEPKFSFEGKLKNIREIDKQTDYIAITNDNFITSVNDYLQNVSGLYNFTYKLYSVQDIANEFGYGYNTPEAVKKFIKYAFQKLPSPKPSYLGLFGDATYDYKGIIFKQNGAASSVNYVPSFGDPVADGWYVIWDESLYPQMQVGRIPILNTSELDHYLSKVETNFSSENTGLNRRFLFFSGGNSSNAGEVSSLKSVNDSLINKYIKVPPISGRYKHFYKTASPVSNFGPYSQKEINDAISDGGLFISYIGHSGTATWDNGINAVNQLKNSNSGTPLITDFGCSTNKFAEPDIICFGERFLLDDNGQAIGYIGNSSLGFTSTATTAPSIFYSELLFDSTITISGALIKSKIRLLNEFGMSGVAKVYNYSAEFLGDPIVKLKIPHNPNLKISSKDIIFPGSPINSNVDTVLITINFYNYGIVNDSQFKYRITHFYKNNLVETFVASENLPDYQDNLSLWFKVGNMPGLHTLKIELDYENEISELNEDDNNLETSFNVFASELRTTESTYIENSKINDINILGPALYDKAVFDILFQLSDEPDFVKPVETIIPSRPLFTSLSMPDNLESRRYWYRYKINEQENQFSPVNSFYNEEGYKLLLNDSLSFAEQKNENFKITNNSISYSNDTTIISVLSAGFNAGATCVISKNGENLLSNSYFSGMAIVVFNEKSLEVESSDWYRLFNEPQNVADLAEFINSISEGKLVAIGVSNDARNNLSGDLKNAIKTLGSTKIDSLVFRGSWALIGKKGSAPGDVIEGVRSKIGGSVFIETSFSKPNKKGYILTQTIGPVKKWKSISIDYNNVLANMNIYAIHNGNGFEDTVYAYKNVDKTLDISQIDEKYSNLNFLFSFSSEDILDSIILKRIDIDYEGLSELATNYQVVSIVNDSLNVGENVELNFDVYNVGETSADSFYVEVNLANENYTISTNVFKELVTSIDSLDKKSFNVNYNTVNLGGSYKFNIKIDPEDKILELYEDNNFYSVPFYVKPDTTRPTMTLTFDGKDIFDGEYISQKPNIKIELTDLSLVPLTDTSSVKLFLDDEPVYYSNNGKISYAVSNNNPKYVLEFKPELSDGEHSVAVFAKDASGNFAEENGLTKNFIVSNQVKLLDLYNYPNPFSSDTYFTFKLTQIPDEVRIKVYTIAGRLVKEIHKTPAELKYDFNKIYWDGRDEDGDLLGNGVYFYRVVFKAAGVAEDITQKLAIVR